MIQQFLGQGPRFGNPLQAATMARRPGFLGANAGPALGQGRIDDIKELIDILPPDEGKKYLDRLDGCINQLATGGVGGLVSAYKCIDDLYKDLLPIIEALKDKDEIPEPAPKPKPPPPPPTSSALLPVLGVVAAAGIGAYFLFQG